MVSKKYSKSDPNWENMVVYGQKRVNIFSASSGFLAMANFAR